MKTKTRIVLAAVLTAAYYIIGDIDPFAKELIEAMVTGLMFGFTPDSVFATGQHKLKEPGYKG